MNLIPRALRRDPRRAAQDAYFAASEEDKRIDAWHLTLRHDPDPAARSNALGRLADMELTLYRLHDDAFGYTPWPDDLAGDGATGHAHGAMILALLTAAERARVAQRLWDLAHPSWRSHWPSDRTWGRPDLNATEHALADACAEILDRLSTEHDLTERAVLYTRLWITAYPVIGGQTAEWVGVLRNYLTNQAVDAQQRPQIPLPEPAATTNPAGGMS